MRVFGRGDRSILITGLRSICFGSDVTVTDTATGVLKRMEDQFGQVLVNYAPEPIEKRRNGNGKKGGRK